MVHHKIDGYRYVAGVFNMRSKNEICACEHRKLYFHFGSGVPSQHFVDVCRSSCFRECTQGAEHNTSTKIILPGEKISIMFGRFILEIMFIAHLVFTGLYR